MGYGLIEKTFWALHSAHWGCNTSLPHLYLVHSIVGTSTLQSFDIFGCCIQFANSRWPITLVFCEWPLNFVTNTILLHTSVLWFSHITSILNDSCISVKPVHHVWALFIVFTLLWACLATMCVILLCICQALCSSSRSHRYNIGFAFLHFLEFCVVVGNKSTCSWSIFIANYNCTRTKSLRYDYSKICN